MVYDLAIAEGHIDIVLLLDEWSEVILIVIKQTTTSTLCFNFSHFIVCVCVCVCVSDQ